MEPGGSRLDAHELNVPIMFSRSTITRSATAVSLEANPIKPEFIPAFPIEADVDAVLYKAKGDPRAVIRMLLAELDTLARNHHATVSHGHIYGRLVMVRGGAS